MDILGTLFDFINKPLGWLLGTIYQWVGSYGLALILFTIAVKFILLPLAIKQQKSMIQTARLQPIITEIQKKYKHDRQKQSEEMMKLYQTEKMNPAGGCLPLLIQLPIIIALYNVINRPLTYITGLSVEQIISAAARLGVEVTESTLRVKEIVIAQLLADNIATFPEFANLTLVDFRFLGLQLDQTPSFSQFGPLWIIPILAGLTGFFSGYATMKISPSAAAAQSNPQMAGMNKSMMYTMPIMSLVFTFTLPAGVGVYWSISNILMVVQQLALNRLIPAPSKEELEETKKNFAKSNRDKKPEKFEKPEKKRSIYDD